ncbi:hypothetical protein EYZ11_005648 [Aspergillus tanneri]|uniref:Major facilitator superfamily (MFS) profile domain-containing protein n=1 Tax=Aspergillus tanneri TaxID=1220188 RepID=A0A4S3JHG3_9EURO|nr:hypothetical protein EYZ11_005648 [Aspergillus tanneri]
MFVFLETPFTLAIAGWAADGTDSRAIPMAASLLLLLGASLMLCSGRSLSVYIVGRILLGISGAVLWTVGLALVVGTVSKDEIGKCLGYVFMIINMAVLVAPLLGGVVYAAAGFYAVYSMSFGLVAVDVVLRLALIDKKKKTRKWLSEGQGSPEEGQSKEGETSGTENRTIIDNVYAAAIGPSSAYPSEIEDTTSSNIPQLSLQSPVHRRSTVRFRLPGLLPSPRVLTALLGCLVQSTLFSTFDAVLPLHVHDHFGWTSLEAGLIFLALLIPSFASPSSAGAMAGSDPNGLPVLAFYHASHPWQEYALLNTGFATGSLIGSLCRCATCGDLDWGNANEDN